MTARHIAITHTGLVTSVGLTAAQCCAAFRAKISNPTETRFIDSGGRWIMAHQVELAQPWRGLTKLAKMAAMAIEEALEDLPKEHWRNLPLLLCVAERSRPGRMSGLDNELLRLVEAEFDLPFARASTVAEGRVGVAMALARARALSQESGSPVLIAAVDSLLTWPTLLHYANGDRLLSERNSNGFLPGEGAGALLVDSAPAANRLVCTGLGFDVEPAPIDSDKPCRGDGLTGAIKAALADAGCSMHDFDFRLADVSGEQYYFREADLALSRTLRELKSSFDLWHPAECVGEIGAPAGIAMLSLAEASCRKGYALGQRAIAHLSNDGGQRAAMTVELATSH